MAAEAFQYEDHVSEAFDIASRRLPDSISLEKAKSDIKKFVARTDPRYRGLSVRERRLAAEKNKKLNTRLLILVADR